MEQLSAPGLTMSEARDLQQRLFRLLESVDRERPVPIEAEQPVASPRIDGSRPLHREA